MRSGLGCHIVADLCFPSRCVSWTQLIRHLVHERVSARTHWSSCIYSSLAERHCLYSNHLQQLVTLQQGQATPRPVLFLQLKASRSTLTPTGERPDACLAATMMRLQTLGTYPGDLSRPLRAALAPMKPSARLQAMRGILGQTVNG